MKTAFLCIIKYSKNIFISALFIFGFTLNSLSTTFYISPVGNDTTGDGSFINPWKTLFFATQTVTTAGDTIFVKAGVYTETLQCHLSVGVSIEGEGITSVIQSDLTNHFEELLSLKSPEGTNGNQHISNLKFDGQNLSTYWCIWVAGRSNVSIYNCTIQNFRDRGVIFSGRVNLEDFPPDSLYASGNKFYNNIVNNCAAYSDTANGVFGRGCLNIGGQIGMQIYNNTITQNQRPEGQNGWPIKYVNHGYLKNCKIYNNTLTKIPYGGSYPGESGWDFCIELFNIEGLEISGNIIQGSIDLNFNHKGAYDYSAWIHHNIMSRDSLNTFYESGIIFEFGTESAIVEYNILNNISSGVQFNTRDSSVISNCVIRKNLFSNLATADTTGTAGGILIVSEGLNSAIINNLNIDNNTITATSDTNRVPWVGIDFGALNRGFASNIKIRNNIVVGFAGAWLQGSDTTNMDGVHVLTNNSYLNGNNNFPLWPGGVPTNYVDTPYNLPGINPMFDSTTNFLLQSTSPVIDLGVDVGLPFIPVGPDLGYAEYGGGPPLPVKLIDFTVHENKGKNILNWKTANENNSDHFTVEKSNDAGYYKPIGRVNAGGFSSTELKYTYTDALPFRGINYYRLNMVNKDGRSEYSKVVSITNKDEHAIGIKYADLSAGNNAAFLIVNSNKVQTAGLSIADVTGRIFLNTEVQLQKGDNTITRTIPAAAKGIYYVRLFTSEETIVKDVFNR